MPVAWIIFAVQLGRNRGIVNGVRLSFWGSGRLWCQDRRRGSTSRGHRRPLWCTGCRCEIGRGFSGSGRGLICVCLGGRGFVNLQFDLVQFSANFIDSGQILADRCPLCAAEMGQHLCHELHLQLRVLEKLVLHFGDMLQQAHHRFFRKAAAAR